ncbi:MAG: insulinase family protein, partial [Muribaculaceae bacterium]|nr:insulinase family protein [Muribaculaceae bacterium]
THDRNGHQSHTIIGVPLFGREDPRRFPLFLLNNYLAGPCMNSRLNRELREKRGLVYTVDSNVSLMSNAGLLLIYFGSDASSTPRCKRLVYNTLADLADHTLSPRTFNAIKEQYCGQLLVSTDNRESLAMSMGKSLLYFDSVHDPASTAELVRAVSAEQFREVAELCIPENCSSLTIQ